MWFIQSSKFHFLNIRVTSIDKRKSSSKPWNYSTFKAFSRTGNFTVNNINNVEVT
jgi:hypothetical protein